VTATDEVADKLLRYADAKATEKAAKEIAAGLQSDICAAMGDAEVLVGPDGRPLVTWKSAKDSAKTDWEALARELGATAEQIAAHTETKPGSRRFLPKDAAVDALAKARAERGDAEAELAKVSAA
jgi:hypothetical protein